MKQLIKDFEELKVEIEELEQISRKQGRNDLLEECKRLEHVNEDVSIRSTVRFNVNQNSQRKDEMAYLHKELEKIRLELRKKDQKIDKLQKRMGKVEDDIQKLKPLVL